MGKLAMKGMRRQFLYRIVSATALMAGLCIFARITRSRTNGSRSTKA